MFSKRPVLKTSRPIHCQTSLGTVLIFKLPLYESCNTNFANPLVFIGATYVTESVSEILDSFREMKISSFFMSHARGGLNSKFSSPNSLQKLLVSHNEASDQYLSKKNNYKHCRQTGGQRFPAFQTRAHVRSTYECLGNDGRCTVGIERTYVHYVRRPLHLRRT